MSYTRPAELKIHHVEKVFGEQPRLLDLDKRNIQGELNRLFGDSAKDMLIDGFVMTLVETLVDYSYAEKHPQVKNVKLGQLSRLMIREGLPGDVQDLVMRYTRLDGNNDASMKAENFKESFVSQLDQHCFCGNETYDHMLEQWMKIMPKSLRSRVMFAFTSDLMNAQPMIDAFTHQGYAYFAMPCDKERRHLVDFLIEQDKKNLAVDRLVARTAKTAIPTGPKL